MSTSRIARRYARALFRVAGGDLAKAKRYQVALRTLDALFANPDANRVLRSPVMPSDLKRSLLEYGLKQTERDPDLDHLMSTIVDSGRAALVPEITTAFGELIDQAEGIVKTSVTSAVPLPETELQEIGSAVSALLQKRAEVDAKVDPALLGGFQIRVGQYLIDLSLKTKLDGLSQRAAVDSLR